MQQNTNEFRAPVGVFTGALTGLSAALAAVIAFMAPSASHAAEAAPDESAALRPTLVGWFTNGPAVFAVVRFPATNTAPKPSTATASNNTNGPNPAKAAEGGELPAVPKGSDGGSLNSEAYVTNGLFNHFQPGSLNNIIWTNFLAHANGRQTTIWSTRLRPANWPTNPPVMAWNTHCLMWGMKGLTALSPCWESEGGQGQVPITALTPRHGYTRGHGMGADGVTTNLLGKKVWFLTTNNTLIEVTVERSVVRTGPASGRDYSILQFSRDLPASIEPIRVASPTEVSAKYPHWSGAPWPLFKTEQGGNVSAEVPGLTVNTWKGGDSGSPDMLPLPNELVFLGGRSTSGPSKEMQADINALCALDGLNKTKYQLQWVDLSAYPTWSIR